METGRLLGQKDRITVGTATLLSYSAIHPTELVDALNTLGVCFLQGGSGAPRNFAPALLMAALASSPEARLRMALIPLLLAHPEFAAEVRQAERSLPAKDAVVLRCTYTAAVWLRAKYGARLEAACGPQPALPDLFGEALGIRGQTDADSALEVLAQRQRELTGIGGAGAAGAGVSQG